MRRARDSLRLLIRLGSLPECTQPASQAAAAGFAQPRSTPAAVLAGRLWQAGAQQAAAHYHSPSCSRQLLLGVRSAGQTGRPYRLGTRRGFSSEAPQSSEAASEARMMDLMSKRLGGRATDQMLYGVGGDCCGCWQARGLQGAGSLLLGTGLLQALHSRRRLSCCPTCCLACCTHRRLPLPLQWWG